MTIEFEETKKFWAQEIIKGNLLWPDEFVIRFINRNYRTKKGIRILDYGCGGGRNAIALALEGYSCVAMDYNEEALQLLQDKLLTSMCKNVELKLNRGFDIPIEEESVDAVIADGSLFYNRMYENEIILSNLFQCLKHGGLIWANWRTKKDSLWGNGEYLGDGLYRLSDGTGRMGCCYFFADKSDIESMYQKAHLHINSIDTYEYTDKNGIIFNSYYHVIAEK